MAPKAVLIGLPGSGKSTIGRRLAKALGLGLLDTDAEIERRTGRTVAEIFAADGEACFRRIEEELIREALRDHDGILSLGGGAITTEGVREALAGHTVVYLEISVAEGIRRTSGSTARPLLAGPDRDEKYRELMSQRAPLYRRVGTIRINTNRRNPGAVVRHIVARLDNPQSTRRRRPPWRRTADADTRRVNPPAPAEPSAASVPPADTGPVTPATLARRAGMRK
jgi:shikimate kinase